MTCRIVFFCFVFCTYISLSQGFDWQISPRLPFEIPRNYLGITGGYSKTFYNGSLILTESFVNCTKFETGEGRSYSFGFVGENWFTPYLSFGIEVKYSFSRGKMVAMADSFPVLIKLNPAIVKVENEMFLSYNYLVLTFGGKIRLWESKFYIGTILDFDLKVKTNYEVFEQVLSPPEYHFVDFTQRRKLFGGKISDLSFFSLSPKLVFGYDATLGIGLYASPRLAIEFPFFNYSKEDRLRLLAFSFCINILYGIW
ncbi:MAG: hypothetical protein ACUVQ1_00835 [Candidatus Kapaibacteriales bacterium]